MLTWVGEPEPGRVPEDPGLVAVHPDVGVLHSVLYCNVLYCTVLYCAGPGAHCDSLGCVPPAVGRLPSQGAGHLQLGRGEDRSDQIKI